MKLILASNSPRRKELLQRDGFEFEVKISNALEIDCGNPIETAEKNALNKAKDVFDNLKDKADCCVLSADTVVYFNGEILGKPKSEEDAFNMLKKLSNNAHYVITGFCIKTQNEEIVASSQSIVYFNPLTDEFIKEYIKTGSPMDKAGAYGIQDQNGIVKTLIGSFDNVIGLPTEDIEPILYRILAGNNFELYKG